MLTPDIAKYAYYEYDPVKDLKLRLDRGIGFEDVIKILRSDRPIKGGKHPNAEKYPNQYVYEVEIEGYMYIIPFVADGKKAFLKTIFPSRKATKMHKGDDHEKRK